MRSLREWINDVDSMGELHRVSNEVDWNEELAAVTYMRSQDLDAPALLFEDIKGHPEGFRVLSNILGTSYPRLGYTFDVDFDTDLDLIRQLRDKLSKTIPPETVSDGPIYENSKTDFDLFDIPAPKFWPKDGGRYLGTACVGILEHPEKDWLNAGVYRGMIQSEDQVGFYISPGKDAREIIDYWWERDEPCEVAVAYGMDPLGFVLGSTAFGSGQSELDYMGGMLGEPLEMVAGKETGIPFPANAEIVVEGKLEPGKTMGEGPFGEFQGYYGRPEDNAYVIDVDALHHRDDPILLAALMADYPGGEQNDFMSVNKAARTWNQLESVGVSGVEGVYCHPAAMGGHGMTIVSIKQQRPGHARQVAGLAAELPSSAYINKYIIAVDHDVDPTDINQVLWAMTTRCNPEEDFNFHTDTWSTWLDPSQNPPEERPWGSRVLINATIPYKFYDEFSERTKLASDTYEMVKERWDEYGFEQAPPNIHALLEERSEETQTAGDSDGGAWM